MAVACRTRILGAFLACLSVPAGCRSSELPPPPKQRFRPAKGGELVASIRSEPANL